MTKTIQVRVRDDLSGTYPSNLSKGFVSKEIFDTLLCMFVISLTNDLIHHVNLNRLIKSEKTIDFLNLTLNRQRSKLLFCFNNRINTKI